MGDNLISRIKAYNEGRDENTLNIKYELMRESSFRFFRATAHLFYEDIPTQSFLFNAPPVWLCGDLHLENFGSYKGDDKVAYFNINDFDECVLGSPLLDIVRLMTSVYVASDCLQIPLKVAHKLNDTFIGTYFNKLGEGYIRVLERETARGVVKKFLAEVKNRKRKEFIKKRTWSKKGAIRLVIDPVRTAKAPKFEREIVERAFGSWAQKTGNLDGFKVKDIALRIAGTSSLGLKRYVVLVEKKRDPGSYYLIDIKESRPSCLNSFVHVNQPKWPSEADRITEIEKRFVSEPPALLQRIYIDQKAFVLQELQPTADRINYELFADNPKKLHSMLADMACIYAWSNLRASGRQGSAIADELIDFAKQKKSVEKELKEYALRYAKEMKSYYKSYCEAFDDGLLKV